MEWIGSMDGGKRKARRRRAACGDTTFMIVEGPGFHNVECCEGGECRREQSRG